MSRTLPNLGAILRPAATPEPTGNATTEPVEASTRAAARPNPATEQEVVRHTASTHEVSAESAPRAWDVTSADVDRAEMNGTVYLVPRQVYLPRSTHAQAKAYMAVSGIPMSEMIVTALSDLHAALPAIMRQAKLLDDASAAGELYAIPQRARRNRNPDRQVQTSIRVTDQQLMVMDELAALYGVNRSKLLAKCLQMWLAERATKAAQV